jgi:hypothetical protein
VDFYVDGKYLTATEVYTVPWDSNSVANGSHQISAVAHHSNGDVLGTSSVNVGVSNGTLSTPTPTPTPKSSPTPTPSPSPSSSPTATPDPVSLNGVYDLGSGSTFASSVLLNKNVDGLAYRGNWTAIEPSEGSFNWAPIDSVIATAKTYGKKVSISITAGYRTPAWVFSDGAQAFKFVWDKNWGPAYCTIVTIPVPWDSVFLNKWGAFITALGARYSANPYVSHVKFTGVNSISQETNLPYHVNENINNGQCTGYNDVQDWVNVGYTRVKVLDAWEQIAGTYETAFPDRQYAAMLQPCNFPPIDDNGNIISGETCDTVLAQEMNSYGVNTLGSGRFVAQNNGVSPTWIMPMIVSDAPYVDTGYQELNAQGGNFGATCNNVITNKGDFLEAYESDLTASGNQSAITTCHSGLLGN